MENKFDLYQTVSNQIIESLEKGVVPWKCPFQSMGSGLPMNLISGKHYQGINLLMLGLTRYESPYWLTAKQAFQAGGRIKKGEKASIVVFWKILETEKDGDEEKTTFRPLLRYYSVFNVQQTTGLDHLIPKVSKPVEFNPNEACEKIVQDYVNAGGPEIRFGYTGASYSPYHDVIEMPSKDAFKSGSEFYQTIFHEISHSAGHPKRLNRKSLVKSSTENFYSLEELVAEISSCFLAMKSGIQPDIQNSASYIDGWLKVLKGDKKMIVFASAMAQKSVNHILGERVEAKVEEKSFLKAA